MWYAFDIGHSSLYSLTKNHKESLIFEINYAKKKKEKQRKMFFWGPYEINHVYLSSAVTTLKNVYITPF